MMNILVTGGAGYIGSHTAKALSQAGFTPIAFDNLSTGHRTAVKWGPLIEGDLATKEHIKEAITQNNIQAVIHFAANAYVGESITEPRKYFRNNVVNSINLLDAMIETNVNTIIYSSSSTIYGIPQTLPIPEEHPQHPISPYGESKLFIERVLSWYNKAYGLNWLALRYFNAAGADPDAEIGENHTPETHIIPRVILTALKQTPHVDIFGNNYPTPDGTAVRDFIHVTDLASAHTQSLKYLLNNNAGLGINLGTGTGYSVKEIINAVEEYAKCIVSVHYKERRAGDPHTLIASNDKAAKILGWKPELSDLSSIIKTAWQWHDAQLKCN